ncbi:hypothetical protein NE237_024744 [Protea cynaroides]|uniref:Uncharacterized protein n=1 Tax=Protea cynaroides TaxID=273540 RepID=A0A9Q0K130_9MAGN|nr:hypothetical protein NE237_024744 [Protea cynaroides]
MFIRTLFCLQKEESLGRIAELRVFEFLSCCNHLQTLIFKRERDILKLLNPWCITVVVSKVTILGNFGVGKTSLMNQYVNRKFSNQFEATDGVEFLTKEVQFEDFLFTLLIIGIRLSWRDSEALVIHFTMVRTAVFLSLMKCPSEPGFFPLVVLGNKMDVDDGNSRVESEKAKAWCASKGNIPYFETSAKEGINVEAAFECIVKNAVMTHRKIVEK